MERQWHLDTAIQKHMYKQNSSVATVVLGEFQHAFERRPQNY